VFQPVKKFVIPAQMPESSHRDVKICLAPRRVMPQRYRKVTIHGTGYRHLCRYDGAGRGSLL